MLCVDLRHSERKENSPESNNDIFDRFDRLGFDRLDRLGFDRP